MRLMARSRFSFLAPNFRGENKSQISSKKVPRTSKRFPGELLGHLFQKLKIEERFKYFRLEINSLNFSFIFNKLRSPEQWGIEIGSSNRIFEGQRNPFWRTWRFPEVPRRLPKVSLSHFSKVILKTRKNHFFLQYNREVPRRFPGPGEKHVISFGLTVPSSEIYVF